MKWKLRLMVSTWLFISLPAVGQKVYVYNQNGSIPLDKLQYSLWDLSERTGIELTYGGVVGVGYVPDSIVVRVGSFEEWGSLRADALASQTHWPDLGCEIVFNPYYVLLFPIAQGLISHEAAHCFGAWQHLPDPVNTLYPTAGEYGITQRDALAILAAPTWAPTKPPSLCHAVLDRDWNLLIPEISGFRAKLKYLGDNTWKLEASGINSAPQGCSGFKVENGRATLPDVRLYGGLLYSVVLEHIAGNWKLAEAHKL